MAYKIAICDDEQPQVALLCALVRQWAAQRQEGIELHCFSNTQALRFAWEASRDWTALLLDIQMPGGSGMELAHWLRRQGSDVPILFITGVAAYMDEGYDVAALHYLLKPVQAKKLFACLDRAAQQTQKLTTLLLSDAQGAQLRLPQRHIRYLEARAHVVEVHADPAQGLLQARGGLDALQKQLETDAFVRCHRSYIAGLRWVQRLEREQLLLEGGAVVPISRRLYQQVKEAFVRYYGGGEETL